VLQALDPSFEALVQRLAVIPLHQEKGHRGLRGHDAFKARNASIESLSTIWCNSVKVLLARHNCPLSNGPRGWHFQQSEPKKSPASLLTRAYKSSNCVISPTFRRLASKRIGISLLGFFDELLV